MNARAPRPDSWRRRTSPLLLASLLLAACGGTKSTTTGKSAAPADCAALKGYGFAPSEAAGPSDSPPESVTSLEELLSWYRGQPTLWSRNLGFGLALDRVAEGGEWSIGGEQTVDVKPLTPLPSGVSNARFAAREAYLRAMMSGGELLTVAAPVPGSFQQGRSFDTVALWTCGRNFPVYVEPGRPVEGVLVSPDRSRLAVVHVGKRQYSGAAVPLYLGDVDIVVVDLRTFATSHIPVDVGDTFGIQSLALAWASPTRLRLRIKDTWNTARDKRIYASCDVEKLPCTLPTAETSVEKDFPRDEVLEVTSLSSYQLEPMPQGFQPPASFVPRTLHVSPDRRWVSFVTDDRNATDMFPSTKRLWARPLSGGQPVLVAKGEGSFHARWLDDEQFVFEAPMEPTPKLANAMAARRQDPQLKLKAEAIAGDERDPDSTARVLERLLQQEATARLAEQGKTPDDLWRLPLRGFSVRTGKTTEYHPGPARLWSHSGGPTHHRKGPAREVPAD